MMALGVALAVYAALLGTAVPRVSAAAHDVEAARSPRMSVEPAAAGLTWDLSTATVADRPWTRVSVRGADVRAPRPPGVAAWPAAGRSLVSPALRALAARDPGVATVLGELAPGSIGRAGLTAPDELVSYTIGVPVDVGSSEPVVEAFGNDLVHPDAGAGVLLVIEVAVLVLGPTLLFLLTALRLSAASRSRRSFALGLAGMAPPRIARLYAHEMTVVAAAGLAVGLVGYDVSQGALGASGLFGVRWWPEQGRIGPVLAAVVAALGLGVVATAARRSMESVASRTRSERDRGLPRVLAAAAAALGATAAGFLAFVAVHGWLRPSSRWATDGYAAAVAIAVLLSVAAVVVGVPELVARTATAAARRRRPAIALGLRGAALRSSSGRRLVACIACAVMVAGLGAGFVESLHRGAFGSPDDARIAVDLSQLRAEGGRPSDLPAGPFTLETALRGTAGTYAVVIGDCPAVRRQASAVFEEPGRCTGDIQRGSGGIGGATARSFRVGRRDVAIPPGSVTPGVTWDLKVPLAAAPWLDDLAAGQVTYWVSREDGSYDRVLRSLMTRFPELEVEAGLKDPAAFASYRQQVGTVRAAGLLGVALSVFAFLLSVLESRWERTRSSAALLALGASRRILRTANLVECTYPVIVAAVPAAAVGIVGGWAVLSFRGTDGMFAAEVVWSSLLGVVAAVPVAATAGWVTGGRAFRREDLTDTG